MSRQGTKSEGIPVRPCTLGCAAALGIYLLLQLLLAALVNKELLALESLPPALGASAGAAVLLGGLFAGRGQGMGRALVAGVVLAGFLLAILAVSMAGGARPWAAEAGGAVLLGSLAGAMAAALVKGGKKKPSYRKKPEETRRKRKSG